MARAGVNPGVCRFETLFTPTGLGAGGFAHWTGTNRAAPARTFRVCADYANTASIALGLGLENWVWVTTWVGAWLYTFRM